MTQKRVLTFVLAIMLGVGCGFGGVWMGEQSIPYPEPTTTITVDGDALRAALLDASLTNTKAWIARNYILDREAEAHETTGD